MVGEQKKFQAVLQLNRIVSSLVSSNQVDVVHEKLTSLLHQNKAIISQFEYWNILQDHVLIEYFVNSTAAFGNFTQSKTQLEQIEFIMRAEFALLQFWFPFTEILMVSFICSTT
jgi:hypothetical protein